jgi:hypothetical protein
MREIKFRAWNKPQKKMYLVTSLGFENDGLMLTLVHVRGVFSIHPPHAAPPDELELMQFTGLKDRNGKDIYEGDILSIEGATAKVVFWERPPAFGLESDHYAWCEDWNLSDDSTRMEIIGTIYEHSELLKEGHS